MVLLAALEEWLIAPDGEQQPLSAQEYWDGTVYPDGFRLLEAVDLDGMLPTFRWVVDGRIIEKRIWMEHRISRTVLTYRLGPSSPLTLELRPRFAHRDYHEQRHGQGGFDMAESSDGWVIDAAGVRSHFEVRPSPVVRSRPDWYWRVLHRAERERGLDDEEDLFTPGTVELALDERNEVVVLAGTEPAPRGWDVSTSLRAAQERQAELTDPGIDHPLAGQLAVAGEQFRVARASQQRTVIAGYHWFADWGRDTMISLPALAMRPGTLSESPAGLDTYIRHLDHGLIPNRFPGSGEPPEYDTIDATLWLFQAVAAYLPSNRGL